MKISDLNTDGQTIQYINQVSKTNPVEKNQTPPEVRNQPSSEDKVDLSPEAREMKRIYDILEATPDVRAERVDPLKKAIEANQYQVNSDSLADKMIRDSLLELNK